MILLDVDMILLDVDPNVVEPGWAPLLITILLGALPWSSCTSACGNSSERSACRRRRTDQITPRTRRQSSRLCTQS